MQEKYDNHLAGRQEELESFANGKPFPEKRKLELEAICADALGRRAHAWRQEREMLQRLLKEKADVEATIEAEVS